MTSNTDPLFSDELVQHIRKLYNAGADVDYLVNYVSSETGVIFSKQTIHMTGQRQVYRSVNEPDGTPCKPAGVYDILREQCDARIQQKTTRRVQVVDVVVQFLIENPHTPVRKIAIGVSLSEQSVRTVLKQLEQEGKAQYIEQKHGNGRPRDMWSIVDSETGANHEQDHLEQNQVSRMSGRSRKCAPA
jgi:hypothetical protein